MCFSSSSKAKNDVCLMLAYRVAAYAVDKIKMMERSIVLDYIDKFSTIYCKVPSPTHHSWPQNASLKSWLSRFSKHDWKHSLYASAMEKLPKFMARRLRKLKRYKKYHFRGSAIIWYIHFAFLLWRQCHQYDLNVLGQSPVLMCWDESRLKLRMKSMVQCTQEHTI